MLTLVLGGLALGAVYALVAIGYNIVFVSSKTFNFAQAQLMMVGAFITFTATETWRLPWYLAALMAAVGVTAVAVLEYYIAIRPVKNHDNILVTTLGVSILLTGAAQLIWGGEPLTVGFFGGNDALDFLGARVFPVELTLIALVVVLVVLLGLYGRYSLTGLALRAMSEDREAAQLRGVNVARLALIAFIAAGVLAGFLGIFVGPKTYAVVTLGASLALKGFVVLAVGGFGSMPGVLVGGLIVGLVEALAARYLGGDFSNLSVFLILILVLLIRPAGLFVRTRERTV
ncbi:branched-chain amino acid ABC transporter permease [Pseudarthrobacter sp. H2]|uniref:branched-chain amino acid ABC transporter permease n=1 Tax=Pseudarthrobacter sp. H2 TaxID=3418415 RepID=UPI003CF3FC35